MQSAFGIKSTVEPWVVAGDAGKINVFFYGTTSRNFMDSKLDRVGSACGVEAQAPQSTVNKRHRRTPKVRVYPALTYNMRVSCRLSSDSDVRHGSIS